MSPSSWYGCKICVRTGSGMQSFPTRKCIRVHQQLEHGITRRKSRRDRSVTVLDESNAQKSDAGQIIPVGVREAKFGDANSKKASTARLNETQEHVTPTAVSSSEDKEATIPPSSTKATTSEESVEHNMDLDLVSIAVDIIQNAPDLDQLLNFLESMEEDVQEEQETPSGESENIAVPASAVEVVEEEPEGAAKDKVKSSEPEREPRQEQPSTSSASVVTSVPASQENANADDTSARRKSNRTPCPRDSSDYPLEFLPVKLQRNIIDLPLKTKKPHEEEVNKINASNSKRSSSKKRKSERTFICLKCGKDYYRSDHLKRHELTHLKQSPFSCKHCGKSFSENWLMKKHERVHATGGAENPSTSTSTSNLPNHGYNVRSGSSRMVQSPAALPSVAIPIPVDTGVSVSSDAEQQLQHVQSEAHNVEQQMQ